jgi:hypothetical protein
MGDQDTRSPGRPVSSGSQVHGEPWHCLTRTKLDDSSCLDVVEIARVA